MELYMDHVCTHVLHLDLVDMDKNMSTTARLIIICDPVKKLNWLMLQPYKPIQSQKMCPVFCPGKKYFSF